MGRSHLLIPDPHAQPGYHNDRADWLAELIIDLKPDVVINMGDTWDMPSLSSYDRGKKSFQGRNYRKDIEAGLEFNERVWAPVRARKKKLPFRVFLEGNHEERITRAIEASPELDGAISFDDLQLKEHYDEVVRYQGQTPGIIKLDGVSYGHYFISGVMGRAIGGEHPAYSLLTKEYESCTQGHTHIFDYCERTTASGVKIAGMVCGVYQDYHANWAGEANKLWWRGVVFKENVQDGFYDFRTISLDRLKKEYGNG